MSAPARLLALLWALLLAGGCDGGLFGTGDGTDADAGPGPVDAAPPPTDDTGADAGPDAAGETDDDADDGGGASTDGDDGDDGDDGASGEPPAVSLPAPGAGPDVDSGAGDASDGGFVNVQVTHDRGVPLLRGVNLTGAAVRVVARRADGTGDDGAVAVAVAPGTASAAVAVDAATGALAVVDARSSATLAETGPVALGASTLTTLVAFRAGDGAVRAVPLVTSATAPGGGVANVRAILASASGNAGDRVDGIGLRPAGDNPGGAGIDFAPAAAGSIASDYADALPGDYELVLDGRGTGALVTLEAGSTYSLVPGDGDGATVLTIVDGALDDGAP